EDGMDEISVGAPTRVAEMRDGEVRTFTLDPEHFGLGRHAIETLRAKDVAASLAMIRTVLDGREGPAHDVVVLNAGAAVYAAGVAESLEQGVERAREAVAGGAARRVLERLVEFTNDL
ncbi:MAG TPA: anthranilate phosphoribosyltransferase, partial [Gammaproteobacteria bacterium]|nr:anthranilate phosphoribosyltransferase [Gammaproteobacteria bacterium]